MAASSAPISAESEGGVSKELTEAKEEEPEGEPGEGGGSGPPARRLSCSASVAHSCALAPYCTDMAG
eukprot:CAMPEP_0185207610 /NCGR_PEP_ID=MMETSP1140-20130426/60571_1 /TAXON_ID=298111 /ORGANISM="Pavlova sp., Strain CCMP459" /LENGTH=66 /DNA_ID=CAMNT_0027775301 /DNA_START=187 /DNA_END=384 /DNA_ORIENTATION=+